MAYRETHLVRTWTLRSGNRQLVFVLLGALLAILGPAYLYLETGYLAEPMIYAALALPGLLLVAVGVFAGAAYRVHGGKGDVRLYPDRVEVPRARRSGHDVFPLAELQLGVRSIRSSINFVQVSEVVVLDLWANGISRSLAHHLLDDEQALSAMAEDIARTQAGEPPTRRHRPEDRPKDDYEDQLEEELAKID